MQFAAFVHVIRLGDILPPRKPFPKRGQRSGFDLLCPDRADRKMIRRFLHAPFFVVGIAKAVAQIYPS